MSLHKFKIVVVSGMDEQEVSADSVKIYDESGHYVELHPRKSDGEITLSSKERLIISPMSSNCARVKSVSHWGEGK
jgi:hypothetical protein